MAKKYTKKTIDHEARITTMITDRMDKGELPPWCKPWDASNDIMSPRNFDSNRTYKGFFNSMLLSMVAASRLPLFATSKDHMVKKGEKATWIWVPKTYKKLDEKTGKEKDQFCGFRTRPVFHYSQLQLTADEVEALESKYAPKTDGNAAVIDLNDKCEAVVTSMPNAPTIDHNGGNSAFYSPGKDSVSLPAIECFKTTAGYYATLFHELGHSTGHVTRLDRKDGMNNIRFGSHSYSFEELVAELTACFVLSSCGIMTEKEIDNSTAYIAGWSKKLKENKDWMAKASRLQVRQATTFLIRTPRIRRGMHKSGKVWGLAERQVSSISLVVCQ